MSKFIKKCRIEAGLTQEQLADKMGVSTVAVQNWEKGKTGIRDSKYHALAEIFNVPVEKLIQEMVIENDESRLDNWPDFLFDEDTNDIINTLHLNLAQQNLFGLMYIYGSKYLCGDEPYIDTFNKDLKKIPYGFIERVGSVQFINQAEALHKVIQYINTDYLLKVLRINAESEFNVRKLSKDNICEFIDNGFKVGDLEDSYDCFPADGGLKFCIKMRHARIVLPVLEKCGPVHLTDERWSNPIRDDIPEELVDALLEANKFSKELWKEGYYKDKYTYAYMIMNTFDLVTNLKEKTVKEKELYWEINEKGRELLKWFNE